ncbi:hypothetical protein, partial [Pandoraea nosoerga]
MRLVLLAWVAGVWWLQQAAVLPSGRWLAVVLGAGGGACAAIGVVAAWMAWTASRAPGVPNVRNAQAVQDMRKGRN